MKHIILTILALVALTAASVTPLDRENMLNSTAASISKSTPDDEEDPYLLICGEAERAIADKDYSTAALRLREAMKLQPDNPANVLLLSNLGIVYTYLNQDSMALATYDQALSIAPSMTTVMENRALLKIKMGLDHEAWQDFATVIARDSLSASARYYHGMISLYGGDLNTASADFAVLQSVDPDGYNTQVAMSSMFSLTGHDKEAIPYYVKLIELDKSVEYYSALAGCYLSIGELSDASHTIAEGFRQCGEDPELYYYRAWLNRDSYLLDAARSDAKRAIDLGADPVRVRLLFATPH